MEAFRMNPSEQARSDRLVAKAIEAMKLHGLYKKTIDSYCLTLRRIANFFGRCPDNITSDESRTYFKSLTERSSWSTVKADLSSLQFFHRSVLDREMEWVKIVRPPRVRRLPVIATREEVHLLINTVKKLRFRVFFVVVYSLGLRISEGLGLEVTDIDGPNKRVHIRDSKGGRGAVVHLPGDAIPSPDDVFGPAPRISAPSSPTLAASSPNFEPSSPNLDEQRDLDGCLISEQLALPVVDDLDPLSQAFRSRLEGLTKRTRSGVATPLRRTAYLMAHR
jgi:hypothetical protein